MDMYHDNVVSIWAELLSRKGESDTRACKVTHSSSMPKPNKSSASSGTRKKHAKKSAGPVPDIDAAQMKKNKKDKHQPKQKVYILPTRPQPAQPDPIDTLGLAVNLPPELVVVLRKLAKKDATTKSRAIEQLQRDWLDPSHADALIVALPVWVRLLK